MPGNKSYRVVGAERRKMIQDVRKRYAGGASIRAIAAHYQRSYGMIHRLLKEGGTPLRPRGNFRHLRRH
ncbi:helix-turn-helix domain-containing protein [Nonomuraea sp. KM90]|uniref:helix-turn-helix domain-containing protein n=1 Tax=Nonomuraea sp. KM90 TaxID=3457428 RepID=UPI003FCEB430